MYATIRNYHSDYTWDGGEWVEAYLIGAIMSLFWPLSMTIAGLHMLMQKILKKE